MLDSNSETTPQKANSPMELQLVEDSKLAMDLPVAEQNSYWTISAPSAAPKKNRLLSFLKRQNLSEEELIQLRTDIESVPGKAKVKIQDLLKENPHNADLMLLYSLCTYRMVFNSSNRKGALEGLRTAVKGAASALLNDGISLYNCEKFLVIYFEYLNRLKRFQVTTYRSLGETVRQQELRKQLEATIKMCDNLYDEKKRGIKVLNQIKGRFKSSSYSVPWKFEHIRLAGKKLEKDDPRYICGPLESKQLIVLMMAMMDMFARIPVLFPLVEMVLGLIPEGTLDLYLRKASVQSRRAFTQLGLLIQEGDRDRMRNLGRQIYKSNFGILQQIRTHHVKQAFEADPYYNLCRATIMTFGLYKEEEQTEMLQTSIKSIKQLIELDQSKTKSFGPLAEKIEAKLSNLSV